MLRLSQLITEYLDSTKDNDSDATLRAMRRINQAHKYVCAIMKWPFLEKIFTDLTVANQQSYTLPINIRMVKDVTITVGSIKYTPQEIIDPVKWDLINGTSINSKSDAAQFYHIRAGKLYLWPTPSTSSNTITYLALRSPTRDLQFMDYSIGTVALTNGSATVTGTSTSWASTNVKAGAFLVVEDQEYEILSVDSSTQLTLVNTFQGVTQTGSNYVLGDATLIPEPYDDVTWLRASRDFFRNKIDTNQKRSVQEDYNEIINFMERSLFSKTSSNVIPRGQYRIVNPNDYPRITPA